MKDRKQAEFLVEQSFPWKLVQRIGVIDSNVAEPVAGIIAKADHKPRIVVARDWYY